MKEGHGRSVLSENVSFPHAISFRFAREVNQEKSYSAPRHGRFFKDRSKSRHYPVSVVNDRIIRVEWRAPTAWITPRIKKAIEFLRDEKIRIDPQNKEVLDLTWSRADQTSAEDQIIFLAERGDLIAATKLARRGLSMGLTDARKFVEELTH